MREKVQSLETAAEASADAVAQRLLDARTATFWRLQQEKCNDSVENEPAEIPDDPNDEDLEAIEIIRVSSSSAKCTEKLKSQEGKVESARKKAKIMDETREEAYEKYINAQKARRTFSLSNLVYVLPVPHPLRVFNWLPSSAVKKHEEVQNLSTDIENMMDDLRIREKRHRDLRQKLKALTTYKFDELLSMNEYAGELQFDDGDDNRAGTLDLVVTKGSGGQTKDVKGLRYVFWCRPTLRLSLLHLSRGVP
jgi:hypothetical protein